MPFLWRRRQIIGQAGCYGRTHVRLKRTLSRAAPFIGRMEAATAPTVVNTRTPDAVKTSSPQFAVPESDVPVLKELSLFCRAAGTDCMTACTISARNIGSSLDGGGSRSLKGARGQPAIRRICSQQGSVRLSPATSTGRFPLPVGEISWVSLVC